MLSSTHFANRLCWLNEWPVENSKGQEYISKWLITLLTDEKSKTASTDECPVITKKIRDECLGKTDKNFFRRSSYYMCVKVMLHHNLTLELGAALGKFVYKIVMLSFLNELCSDYKDPECNEFDIDLMTQMIAKMARRIDKLSHNKPPMTITKNFCQLYDEVIREAKDTIQVIRRIIDALIKDIQNEDSESAHLSPMINLNFNEDCCYKMPKLIQYLRERLNEAPIPIRTSDTKRKTKSYQRYIKKGIRRPAKFDISQDEMDEAIYWMDFENFVLYEMEADDVHDSHYDELLVKKMVKLKSLNINS